MKTSISVFNHNEVRYNQYINTEDDSTTIEDFDRNVLIKFDSACYAYDKDGKRIGHITGWGSSFYQFEFHKELNQSAEIKGPAKGVEDHLKFEVIVFKALIDLGVIKPKNEVQVLGVFEIDPSTIDPTLEPDENGILSVTTIPFKDPTDEQLEGLYEWLPEVVIQHWPDWVKEKHPNKIN